MGVSREQYYTLCEQHFSNTAPTVRAGPVQSTQRKCNDIFCLIFFVLLMIFTIIIGAIMINDGLQFFEIFYKHNSNTQPQSIAGISNAFSTQGGIIIGMFFFSIALAIGFMFLLKLFPKCMVYTFIISIFLVYAALIVFGAINKIWWMVITFGITAIVTGLVLWCARKKIQTGILLLKIASTFLTQKPSTFLIPLYPFVFSIIFFCFWVCALVAQIYWMNQKSNRGQSISKQNAFVILWIIIFIFMIQFFFYVQTFLISYTTANWYYGLQNGCCKGTLMMNRFHLGSFTFAALLITFIKLLRNLVKQKSNQSFSQGNAIIGVILCLVACCISCIQNLLQTLNHNSIIVMAVTGQSYIDSAKSAFSLIYNDFGLFWIVQFFSDLIRFFGLFICIGLPTLVGFLIIRYGRDANQYETNYATLTIFLLSFMVAGIIISMLPQVLSCLFILFCFDKKFHRMGINVPNCPAVIKQFLNYGTISDPQRNVNTNNNYPMNNMSPQHFNNNGYSPRGQFSNQNLNYNPNNQYPNQYQNQYPNQYPNQNFNNGQYNY